MTPNDSVLQPKTIYGVGKVFNELLGEYYGRKYDMDFRCVRYPGVISSAKYAFNGTTDYSTEIFFEALEKGHYNCWLRPDQAMPMIYIDDCIDATMRYLKADRSTLKRYVYNIAGVSFNPEMLITEV
jgi:threonine 3-dehydrogenase